MKLIVITNNIFSVAIKLVIDQIYRTSLTIEIFAKKTETKDLVLNLHKNIEI